MKYAKLNRLAFAIAASIFWGVGVFFGTLWAISSGHPEALSLFYFYPGYSATITGAFVGLLWGLMDGFIGGFIFAALYNYILWLIDIRKKDKDFIDSASADSSEK